jgi:hypothetical protein
LAGPPRFAAHRRDGINERQSLGDNRFGWPRSR